jgi:IS30 family transposase
MGLSKAAIPRRPGRARPTIYREIERSRCVDGLTAGVRINF